MADNKTIPVTVELAYVPDTYTETERQEGASWPLGSGYYDVVLVGEGARIPLSRFKAGAVDKLLAQAKAKKDEEPPPAEATEGTTVTTSPAG